MGLSSSRAEPLLTYTTRNIFEDNDTTFFDIGFDELIFSNKFHSDLLDKSPKEVEKPLILPNENVVADIITESIASAKYKNVEDKWREVLAPLFTGNENNKSFMHQLLNELCIFFKDRPNSFFNSESNKRLELLENLNNEYAFLLKYNFRFKAPKIQVTKAIISSINDDVSFINAFPFLRDKLIFTTPHSSYKEVGKKIQSVFNAHPSINLGYHMMIWGMCTSDINCILCSLKGFAQLFKANPRGKINHHTSNLSLFSFIQNIPLNNSINFWPSNIIPPSITIPDYSTSEKISSSIISCDGENIFILGPKATVTIISLSKNKINPLSRFQTFPLMIIPKEADYIGIAASNGYAIINGPNMVKPLLYKLPNFEPYDKEVLYDVSRLTRKCKVRPPLACDGKYIYSMDSTKRKINIFTIKAPKIVHLQVVHLHASDKLNSSEFVPKDKDYFLLTNGTVITIIFLKEHSDDKYFYLFRHFSLLDGAHICDSSITQDFPIISIATDPWNHCYWSIVPEKNKVSLIRLDMITSLPLWLTEKNYRIPPSLIDVASAFKYLKNSKNMFLALIGFLDFFTSQFNGLTVRSSFYNHSDVNHLKITTSNSATIINNAQKHSNGNLEMVKSSSSNLNNESFESLDIHFNSAVSIKTAQFFAPCLKSSIHIILSLIEYFLEEIDKSVFDLNIMETLLISLMRLFAYNLEFFNPNVTGNKFRYLSEKTIMNIVKVFYSILSNNSLKFLHHVTQFTIIHCFSLIFSKPGNEKSLLFIKLTESSSRDTFVYMIRIISSYKEFSFVLCGDLIKEFFQPILNEIIVKDFECFSRNSEQGRKPVLERFPEGRNFGIREELFSSYMRNLMFSMKSILQEKPLPIYINIFTKFSELIVEKSLQFIKKFVNFSKDYDDEEFKASKFAHIFSKWVAMLEPYTEFSFLSSNFITILQPLFFCFFEKLENSQIKPVLKLKNGNCIATIYLLFYEIYSLFINFLSSILDGGQEMREIIQYQWLMKATTKAGMTPSIVDNLLKSLKIQKSDEEQTHRMIKGFSFSLFDDSSIEHADIETFIIDFARINETESISLLLNYLYKKAPNPFNKKLTLKDRWIERLIIASFSKQLGIVSELWEISEKLNENEQPVLSHFMKQVMVEVYRVRSKIKLATQRASELEGILLKEKNEEYRKKHKNRKSGTMDEESCCCDDCCYFDDSVSCEYSINELSLPEQNVEYFINQIIKKSVFLLHIEPFMRFESERFETSFTDILMKLQNFLTSSRSIESYFKIVMTSTQLRQKVHHGIIRINEYLCHFNASNVFSAYMIEKFAINGWITNYLFSLKSSVYDKQDMEGIMKLLQFTQKEIIASSSCTLIVFFINICLSIAKISPDNTYQPILMLIDELRHQYKDDIFRSYVALFVSAIIGFSQNNKEILTDTEYQSFLCKLIESPEIGNENLPFARLFLKAGYKVKITILDTFEILRSCPPKMYHSAASLIFALLCRSRNKIRIFHTILTNLSKNVSASESLFMSNYEPYSADSKAGDICRSSRAIIGCASEFIQICRRILIKNEIEGRILTDIIDYILKKFSPEKIPFEKNDYDIFDDESVLYAVFAILSNSITEDHVSSLIRNTLTNAIYYVSDINELKQEYIAWQLPITGDSIPLHIKFAINIVPVSMIPFSTRMYNHYDLLIPYFKNSLLSLTYKGIDFLILMSLRTYTGSQAFMDRFAKENLLFIAPSISYKDSSQYFMKVLLCHLSHNRLGFNTPDETSLRFHRISPTLFSQKVKVTPQKIKCHKGLHIFISTPIPTDEAAKMTAQINSESFSFGAFVPSTSESGVNFIIASCKEGKLENGQEISKFTKYIVKYDPNVGASIVIDKNRINDNILNNISSPICFFIILYDESNVHYSISSTFVDSDLSSNESGSFDEVNISPFLSNKILMNEQKLNYLSNEDQGPIISFPSDVLNAAQGDLKTSFDKQIKNKRPKLRDESDKVVTNQTIPILNNYLFSFVHNGLYYTDRPDHLLYQYKFSGEIVEYKQKHAKNCISLPIFTPNQFPLIPSIFVNYFATGYIERCRIETINVLFIQFISSSTLSIQNILSLFSINLKSLLFHVIKLLVILEPLHFSHDSCFVGFFTENVMKPINTPRLPSLHKYKFALNEIIKFIDNNNSISKDVSNNFNPDNFAQVWFETLNMQFHDIFYHTAHPNHQDAVFKQLVNSPIVIERFDIVGWFVAGVELGSDISFSVNGSRMSKPMKYFEGTKLTITFSQNNEKKHIVAIPLLRDKNDTLDDTFFELAMSFKYFIRYIHDRSTTLSDMKFYRSKVYSLFFESLLSSSPFFTTFSEIIFDYLEAYLPINSYDIEGDYLQNLNLLCIYLSQRTKINVFLKEQEALWNEKSISSLKEFFPEFQISNKSSIPSKPNIKSFSIPPSNIPQKINKDDNITSLLNDIRRIFKPTKSIEGYPFHFLMEDWATFSRLYPIFKTVLITKNIMQVEFTRNFPKTIKLSLCLDAINLTNIQFYLSYTKEFDGELIRFKSNETINISKKKFFLKIENTTWPAISYIISSNDETSNDVYIQKFISYFVDDIKFFATGWKSTYDQEILNCIDMSYFNDDVLTFSILQNPEVYYRRRLSFVPINLISLRTKYLLVINWAFLHYKIKFSYGIAYSLLPSISKLIKVRHFQNKIEDHSNEYTTDIEVDRKTAIDVRFGQNPDLSMSLISQLTRQYDEPAHFRKSSDQPWFVTFKGEPVRDAGGPARELVADLALDLCNPICGLVIQTPNGRNDVGEFRECVIPIANQRVSGLKKKYRFAGALIAIAIRSRLVQQFNFPPLVWNYLVNGQVSIDDIFEIDQNYKLMISSISEAMHSNMTDEDFIRRFNIRFTVINSAGKEIPLTQQGMNEVVTHSSCGLYISMAHEYRLNEMKANLKEMRRGLWDNLGFKAPKTIDWKTLEFAACGEQELSVEIIKKVTNVDKVPIESLNIFWRILEEFTPKERSSLLKFATGRTRLPPEFNGSAFLHLAPADYVDTLPTSSTCFHRLNLPKYSSYETAYKLFKIAIEYTGSFENN